MTEILKFINVMIVCIFLFFVVSGISSGEPFSNFFICRMHYLFYLLSLTFLSNCFTSQEELGLVMLTNIVFLIFVILTNQFVLMVNVFATKLKINYMLLS
jgi:hypothetical protein